MSSSNISVDESQDDEFDVEDSLIKDPAVVLQRLKEFTFYLVENIEYNLNFCLELLEERTTVPSSKNSMHVTALSMLFSAIPKIGGGLGNALKTGETTIFREIEKKNSRILADLVYYFSDNKESFRNTIIEAAIEIFSTFENQFMQLTCNRGEKKAMQQLAVDASDRIFNYFLMTEQKRDVTKIEIIKGVIYGDSKRGSRGRKEGKSVKEKSNSGKVIKWKTSKLYSKAGILLFEKNLCYYNDHTKPEKYKYRKILPWENEDEIIRNWILETNYEIPVYTIEISGKLLSEIKEYVVSKNKDESAGLERKKYDEKAMKDRQEKHHAALQVLKEYFNKILNEIDELALRIANINIENTALLKTLADNQEEECKLQTEIISKLDFVHEDVIETKEKQDNIIKTNEHIGKEIGVIKNNQEEIAGALVKQKDLEEAMKEGAAEGVKELLKETLRKNDPGPSIRREVERLKKRLKKI